MSSSSAVTFLPRTGPVETAVSLHPDLTVSIAEFSERLLLAAVVTLPQRSSHPGEMCSLYIFAAERGDEHLTCQSPPLRECLLTLPVVPLRWRGGMHFQGLQLSEWQRLTVPSDDGLPAQEISSRTQWTTEREREAMSSRMTSSNPEETAAANSDDEPSSEAAFEESCSVVEDDRETARSEASATSEDTAQMSACAETEGPLDEADDSACDL